MHDVSKCVTEHAVSIHIRNHFPGLREEESPLAFRGCVFTPEGILEALWVGSSSTPGCSGSATARQHPDCLGCVSDVRLHHAPVVHQPVDVQPPRGGPRVHGRALRPAAAAPHDGVHGVYARHGPPAHGAARRLRGGPAEQGAPRGVGRLGQEAAAATRQRVAHAATSVLREQESKGRSGLILGR